MSKMIAGPMNQECIPFEGSPSDGTMGTCVCGEAYRLVLSVGHGVDVAQCAAVVENLVGGGDTTSSPTLVLSLEASGTSVR